MLYFAYLPKTTIADIVPVIVAGFDKNFVKPCTPEIANDGTLFYTKHEQYVIENSSHPLKFRSVDWSLKKHVLQDLAEKNVFVGNYKDHNEVLKDIDHKTICVRYRDSYRPLLVKQSQMFNQHHDKEFHVKQLNLLDNFDQPKSDITIDLLDLFDRSKLINFMKELGVSNQEKINFVDFWLDRIHNNQDFMKILLDINRV